MVTARTRDFLLREKVRTTRQAGGDVRALCLSPQWLLPSAASRPIGDVVADLRESADPALERLARALEQIAHLTAEAMSRPQRVDTILGWMRADPRLRPVADRCVPLLERPYLRVDWAIRPTGSGRLHTLRRHADRVTGVRFSADDRSVVTVDQRGRVLLWDTASGAMVGALDPAAAGEKALGDRPRIRVQWGPEDTRALTGGANQVAVLTPQGLLAVWSLAEDVPQPQYAVATGGDGGYSATFLVAVDEETFLTRADDCFRVHEWRTGKVLLILPLDGALASSALGGEKRFFAVESAAGVVDVWDLERRTRAGRINLGAEISTLLIDGYWLVTVDDTDVGRTWWWPDGRAHAVYSGVFDAVRVEAQADRLSYLTNPGELAVVGLSNRGTHPVRAFVPDADEYGRALEIELSERLLATVLTRDEEHRVTIFERAGGRLIADGWGEGEVLAAGRGTRDGQLLLVSGQGEIESWDPAADQVRRTRTGTGRHGGQVAAISHDRRTVAVSAFNDIQLVRPGEEHEPSAYPFDGTPVSAVADPAGRWFATVTDRLVLYVCDPATGQVRHRCAGPAAVQFRNSLNFPAWSPDGRWIVLDDWDRSVLVWDPATGRQLPGFAALDADTVHVASAPAGPLVLRRHRDGHLSLWQFGGRRPLHEFPPAAEVAGDVSGRWLALRDEAGVLATLTAGEKRLVTRAQGVRGMVAEPTGLRLYFWDERGVSVLTVPDGRIEPLPTGGTPIAAVLCDAAGRPRIVHPEDSPVTLPAALSLSPDGSTLAAWHGGTVQLAAGGAHASMTLDGVVRGTAWLAGGTLVTAGTFGLQSLAIGRPAPLEGS